MTHDGQVGVVGAGLGGLAAACVLGARGYRTVVFDKNEWLGGKAAVLEAEGFRFDMGPTILTKPKVLERIFREAGRELSDYLDLRRLDPQWRCFYEDGSSLDLREDKSAMRAVLEARRPGAGAGYDRFMDIAERMHEITERYFFWKPIGGVWDAILGAEGNKMATLAELMDVRLGRSTAALIRQHIPDEQAAQMFDHYCQYVGSAPDLSPAVLCSIASIQAHEGVWYPIGGTGAVPAALRKLAGEFGVEFRPATDVRRIAVDGGRVTGIELNDGERVPLEAVVSNCDAVRTHTELVGGEAEQRFMRRRRFEPACSGVVLYLGLKEKYEHLQHHNFVFSRDPHEEFEAIYRKGEPAADPTVYVCCPSETEPEVAPTGGEALYLLVHTPYMRPHHDWKKMLPDYRQVILDKLKRCAGMADLEERIVFEQSLTPQDIHDRYRVLDGAIYGTASHGTWAGATKPSNRSPDVEGLYLAGGAANPGPGMPMVMMSGWIAADTLDRDRSKAARAA